MGKEESDATICLISSAHFSRLLALFLPVVVFCCHEFDLNRSRVILDVEFAVLLVDRPVHLCQTFATSLCNPNEKHQLRKM